MGKWGPRGSSGGRKVHRAWSQKVFIQALVLPFINRFLGALQYWRKVLHSMPWKKYENVTKNAFLSLPEIQEKRENRQQKQGCRNWMDEKLQRGAEAVSIEKNCQGPIAYIRTTSFWPSQGSMAEPWLKVPDWYTPPFQDSWTSSLTL